MRGIMRFDVVLIRLSFTAIFGRRGLRSAPHPRHRLFSCRSSRLVRVAIIFLRDAHSAVRLSRLLIGAAVGSILGIVGAYLIGSLICSQESLAVPPTTKTFLTLALTFFMAYVGLMVCAAKGDTSSFQRWAESSATKPARRDLKILDTSSLLTAESQM